MSETPLPRSDGGPDRRRLLATNDLLLLAKTGDEPARQELLSRYIPRLVRWASGRLPNFARSLLDTSDLVQDVLLKTLEGLDRVEVRGPTGFQAYVRQAVLNRIRDQVRWSARRPGPDGVPDDLSDSAPSPLEMAIGADVLAPYEAGFARLNDEDREILHLKVELDFDYEQIATITGRPSRDAARMAVQRALTRLAAEMGHER
jgi:RNA polymerase sigma-70 factor (ECF subfamily)